MDDRRAIETAISRFVAAYNNGDVDDVLAYYSEDLIKIRQGALPEARPEVGRRLFDLFGKFVSRVDVVTDEICVSGGIAFTRGSFRVTLTPRSGGEAQTVERRYLEIWRKEEGRWLVFRTMDNIG